MKRFLVALSILASVAVFRAPSSVSAQEIEVEGPLAGAPAVIGLRAYRELRLQVQLHAATTLTDEFAQTLFAGGQIMFHPWDWLGIGVWGGYSPLPLETALTDEVTEKGFYTDSNLLSLPNPKRFEDQIGRLKWIAAPQVSFIPLRGKLSIFESLFIDTDLYVFGGVAFVGLQERQDVAAGRCVNASDAIMVQDCQQNTLNLVSRTAMAPTFGAGLSLYMNDFLALTMEWRAFPFSWNTSGTNEVGNPRLAGSIDAEDRLPHFNHLFALGLAFYVPTEPNLSHADSE